MDIYYNNDWIKYIVVEINLTKVTPLLADKYKNRTIILKTGELPDV